MGAVGRPVHLPSSSLAVFAGFFTPAGRDELIHNVMTVLPLLGENGCRTVNVHSFVIVLYSDGVR